MSFEGNTDADYFGHTVEPVFRPVVHTLDKSSLFFYNE